MKKIMIIEDDPDVIALLEEVFVLPAFTATFINTGEVALAKITSVLPDLVIMDIMMPGMSGFEVCQKLKQNTLTKNIPVIAFTGYDSADNRRRMFAAGVDDYMAKPFDIPLMMSKVKELIGE